MIDWQASKNLACALNSGQLRHQSTDVQQWLARHKRLHLQFTATSYAAAASAPSAELVVAIEKYLDAHTEVPKPLVWTATAESILEKVCSGGVALQQIVDQ
jgi:hypothetical protein